MTQGDGVGGSFSELKMNPQPRPPVSFFGAEKPHPFGQGFSFILTFSIKLIPSFRA